MRAVTEAEVKRAIVSLNRVVGRHSYGSTFRGLEVVAGAFAGLLDVYSQPNANNPQGMCDDPVAFRQIFADAIVKHPLLKKETGGGNG